MEKRNSMLWTLMMNKFVQALDVTIFQNLQAVNNIQLNYIPMEEPAECNSWEETSNTATNEEAG